MHIVLLARKTLYTQPGGDTVQVEETASALRRCGHEASIVLAGDALPRKANVLHGFNLGRPADLLPYFRSFKGKKILSSIYVDYSLADQQRFSVLYSLVGKHGLEYVKTIARALNGSRNLVSQAGNSRLNETLTTLRAGVSAAAQTWGSSTDVISAIDEKMKEIADSIGLLPNRVVFNLGAWEAFKNNSTVIDRYPGAVTAAPQIGGIGSLFLNPDTKCMMSTSVFDTKIRQTSAKANALTSDVWIYYSSESVDMFDPSAFKTFRVRNNPFGGVRVVQKDFGEKVITEWTEAAFVNNVAAAKRLDITVS